ncbi:MAG: hypothetical protein AB7G17_09375 [Phycisphaerales bacterium]
MTPPLPILCSSCGYDITFLADATRADPTLPCPECGASLSGSLPESRSNTYRASDYSLRAMLRVYLDAHLHPIAMWRRAPLNKNTGALWIVNAALAAILLAFIPLTLGLVTGDLVQAAVIALLMFFAAWAVITFLSMLIALLGLITARILRWRVTRETFWVALDRSTLLWPLSSVLMVVVDRLLEQTSASPQLTFWSALAVSVTPPSLLILTYFLYGLRALRFANPPQPPPDPSLPSPP